MHTLDPERLQTLDSDTDSIYFALAAENLEDIVVNKELWEGDYHLFFPSKSHDYKTTIKRGKVSQKISHNEYDQRTPLLFKVEYEGDGMVCLGPKLYHAWCANKEGKLSMKGANKNLFVKEHLEIKKEFLELLYGDIPEIKTVNHGFKQKGNDVVYYQLPKKVCSKNRYDKRKITVKGDGSFLYEWTGL